MSHLPCASDLDEESSSFNSPLASFVVCNHEKKRKHLSDNTLESVLEPLDGLGLVDAVRGTNLGLATAATSDTLTGTLHAAVEVHTVDTDTRVVLETEIDVLADTETEVASLGEVALAELVLLDLKATLDDLLGLGATDGDVDSDLLVTADTESTDSVAGLGVDGGLTRQLLENLGGTSKSVTRLTDRDVQDELGDAELAHGVGGLGIVAALLGLLGCLHRSMLGVCSSIYVLIHRLGRGQACICRRQRRRRRLLVLVECASVEMDVIVWLPSLDSFFFFLSSSTSESREGVASVESKRGEAQIVVVVVDIVGAVCGSLP